MPLRAEVFEPVNGSSPQITLVTGNVLNGSLDDDHRYRPLWMASNYPWRVIAYERPGTGSAPRTFNLGLRESLQPTRLAETASYAGSQLAHIIDKFSEPVIMGSASGGAHFDIAMVGTKALIPDYLAPIDPTGIKNQTVLHGIYAFIRQQIRVEPKKPDIMKNQHPAGSELSAGGVDLMKRFVGEVAHYGPTWSTDISLSTLRMIPTDPDYSNMAVNALFFGHSPAAHSDEMRLIVEELNNLRPDNTGAPFQATYRADLWHSYPDDPARLADWIDQTVSN